MERFVYAVSTQLPTATDTPVVLVRSGSVVMGAIIQATVTAMFFICALLALVLRNFWDAVLVLLTLPFYVCVFYRDTFIDEPFAVTRNNDVIDLSRSTLHDIMVNDFWGQYL